jgi:hypothetical protein
MFFNTSINLLVKHRFNYRRKSNNHNIDHHRILTTCNKPTNFRIIRMGRCLLLHRGILSCTNLKVSSLQCPHLLWIINHLVRLEYLIHLFLRLLFHKVQITGQYRKWINKLYRMQTPVSNGFHLTDTLNSKITKGPKKSTIPLNQSKHLLNKKQEGHLSQLNLRMSLVPSKIKGLIRHTPSIQPLLVLMLQFNLLKTPLQRESVRGLKG